MARLLGILVLLTGFGAAAQIDAPQGISNIRPQLLPQKGYTETWDQHIYFEDGTFITARFLIANLTKGKARAFVIATLVTPDGHKFTVKNGRDRGGWSFNPDRFDIHIAGHRLNGEAPDYRLHLHNNTAEILLTLKSPKAPWQVGRICCGTSPEAYQDMIAYIPVAEAEGWYRPGPDAGGKGDEEPWRPLKGGRGFATHYVNSQSVEKVARNWLHFFAFDKGESQLPGLVSLSLPDGGQMTRLALLNHVKPVFESDAVVIDTLKTQSDGDGNSVPLVIRVNSSDPNGLVTGTITFDRLLERIELKEKLTWIERIFASSLPGTAQYYYLVHYDLKTQIGGITRALTGQGMAEYTAISEP
jgi:hypothetical protein